MYRFAQLLDEEVYIVASPVSYISESTAVMLEVTLVGNGLTGSRIRIEIIVDMDSVDIIPAHDIVHHSADVIPVLGQGRVENIESVIREDAVGMGNRNVVCSQLAGRLRLGTVRIDPRMKLHTPPVTLVYHPLQRIPVRRRRRTLPSRKELAPRFVPAWIERITLCTHLEDDGIHAVLLQLVQLITQRTLHFLCADALELSVHTLYPCTTEFPLLRLALAIGRITDADEQNNGKQQLRERMD